MADLEKLRALVEAAPDWDPQVDLGKTRRDRWFAEIEAVGPITDDQAVALAKLFAALDRATLLELLKPDDCQAGDLGLSRDEALKRYGVHVVLGALPHLAPADLQRVLEASPMVATGGWSDEPWPRRFVVRVRTEMCARIRPGGDNERAFVATTWIDDKDWLPGVTTQHDTREEAEETVTKRMRAAGVRCGEVADG